jgi:hypothetical protein
MPTTSGESVDAAKDLPGSSLFYPNGKPQSRSDALAVDLEAQLRLKAWLNQRKINLMAMLEEEESLLDWLVDEQSKVPKECAGDWKELIQATQQRISALHAMIGKSGV